MAYNPPPSQKKTLRPATQQAEAKPRGRQLGCQPQSAFFSLRPKGFALGYSSDAGHWDNYSIGLGKLSRPHCDLTGVIVSKENNPQMALIQVSEILQFTQTGIYGDFLSHGLSWGILF